MKKQILFLLALSIISFVSDAQKKEENALSYSEFLNDPYKIPNLEIKLSPMWMSYSQLNTMLLGWGATTEFTFANRILLDLNYQSTYTKKFLNSNYPGSFFSTSTPINYDYTHKNESSLSITQDIKGYYQFEAGISIIFNDKVRVSKDAVVLHSSQSNLGTVTVINQDVTYVDSKIRRRWSTRIGYQLNRDVIDLYNIKDMVGDENYFVDDEGNKFYGDGIGYVDVNYNLYDADYSSYNYTEADDSYSDYQGWATNLSAGVISFGLSRDVVKNFVIDVEGYGKRGNQRISKLFFDVLYAASITVDPIVFFKSNPDGIVTGEEMGTTTKEYQLATEGENSLETNNLGFRIGYETHGISPTKIIPWAEQDEYTRYVNLGYKGELGYKPGIKGKGFYMTIGIYLAINGKI